MKGENVPKPGIPESFKVLVKEIRSLALDIEPLVYESEPAADANADLDEDFGDVSVINLPDITGGTTSSIAEDFVGVDSLIDITEDKE